MRPEQQNIPRSNSLRQEVHPLCDATLPTMIAGSCSAALHTCPGPFSHEEAGSVFVTPQQPAAVVPAAGGGDGAGGGGPLSLEALIDFGLLSPTVIASRLITQYFALTSPVCQSMQLTCATRCCLFDCLRALATVRVRLCACDCVHIHARVCVFHAAVLRTAGSLSGHVPPISWSCPTYLYWSSARVP